MCRRGERIFVAQAVFTLGMLFLLSMMPGCDDDRVKRAVSMFNVKTQTAAKEFAAAGTDADKAKVAAEYFKLAPAYTQLAEDYVFKRPPTAPVGGTTNGQ